MAKRKRSNSTGSPSSTKKKKNKGKKNLMAKEKQKQITRDNKKFKNKKHTMLTRRQKEFLLKSSPPAPAATSNNNSTSTSTSPRQQQQSPRPAAVSKPASKREGALFSFTKINKEESKKGSTTSLTNKKKKKKDKKNEVKKMKEQQKLQKEQKKLQKEQKKLQNIQKQQQQKLQKEQLKLQMLQNQEQRKLQKLQQQQQQRQQRQQQPASKKKKKRKRAKPISLHDKLTNALPISFILDDVDDASHYSSEEPLTKRRKGNKKGYIPLYSWESPATKTTTTISRKAHDIPPWLSDTQHHPSPTSISQPTYRSSPSSSKKNRILPKEYYNFHPQTIQQFTYELEAFYSYVQLRQTEKDARDHIINMIKDMSDELYSKGTNSQSKPTSAVASLPSNNTNGNYDDGGIHVQTFGSYFTPEVCCFSSDIDLAIWGVIPPKKQSSSNTTSATLGIAKNTHFRFTMKEEKEEEEEEEEDSKESKTKTSPTDKKESKEERLSRWRKVLNLCSDQSSSDSDSSIVISDDRDDDDNNDEKEEEKKEEDTKPSSTSTSTTAATEIETPFFVIDRNKDEGYEGDKKDKNDETHARSSDGSDNSRNNNKDKKDKNDETYAWSSDGSDNSRNDNNNNDKNNNEEDDDEDDDADKMENFPIYPNSWNFNLDVPSSTSAKVQSKNDTEGKNNLNPCASTSTSLVYSDDDDDSIEVGQVVDLCSNTSTSSDGGIEVDEDNIEVSCVNVTDFGGSQRTPARHEEDDNEKYPRSKKKQCVKELRRLSRKLWQEKRTVEKVEVRARAKVPIICVTTRLGFDSDIAMGGHAGADTSQFAKLQVSRYKSFGTVVLFLKILLLQTDLDKPFTGGLGSFKLYVLVAHHFDKHVALGGNQNPAEVLLSFFFRYSKWDPNYKNNFIDGTFTPITTRSVLSTKGGEADLSAQHRLDECVALFGICFRRLMGQLKQRSFDLTENSMVEQTSSSSSSSSVRSIFPSQSLLESTINIANLRIDREVCIFKAKLLKDERANKKVKIGVDHPGKMKKGKKISHIFTNSFKSKHKKASEESIWV